MPVTTPRLPHPTVDWTATTVETEIEAEPDAEHEARDADAPDPGALADEEREEQAADGRDRAAERAPVGR